MEWRSGVPEYVINIHDVVAPPTLGPKGEPVEVTIHAETTDTGERMTLFGLEARRFITVETCISTHPRYPRNTTTEIDGWHIDWSELPGYPHPDGVPTGYMFVVTPGEPPPDIQIKGSHVGPVDLGLPVRVTQRQTNVREDELSVLHTTEVLELVRTSIADDLFRPPAGYRQVEHLS